MIDPYAGMVPGMNDPAMLPAPRATSSLFGLMLCPKRAAFCLAATILSKNPMTEINLARGQRMGLRRRWERALHSRRGGLAQVAEGSMADRELDERATSVYGDISKNLDPIRIPVKLVAQNYQTVNKSRR